MGTTQNGTSHDSLADQGQSHVTVPELSMGLAKSVAVLSADPDRDQSQLQRQESQVQYHSATQGCNLTFLAHPKEITLC